MPSYDYIPSTDEGVLTWAQVFGNGISADPALFMMTGAQADSIQNAISEYQDALLIASADSTRTKGTVATKKQKKAALLDLCRTYAMLIKENDGIDVADKIAIGVRPVNPTRTPIDAPSTSPIISIVVNGNGYQQLQYSDELTPNKAARPFGVTGLELYVAVTDTPTATFAEANIAGVFTRNPVVVNFDADDNQKVATYWARWINAKGEPGPWSTSVQMAIAANAAQAA